MTGNRIFKLTLLVFIVALAATSVVFVATSEIGVKASGPVGPVIPTWPQFTMVYETDRAAIAIGQNPAEVTREVRRLEYQSETQWKDIVIEAPTIETRVGQFNRVGSFQQLNGRTFTEFDALGGSSHETTVEEGTRVTSGFMLPFPIEESGVEFTPVTTNSRVCFRDRCTDNAEGRLCRKASGSEMVFVNDARGIPLRVGSPSTGDAFIIKEIQIDDTKKLSQNGLKKGFLGDDLGRTQRGGTFACWEFLGSCLRRNDVMMPSGFEIVTKLKPR